MIGPRSLDPTRSSAHGAVLHGDYAEIPLFARDGSVRAYTLVDIADIPLLGDYRWTVSNGYTVRGGRHTPRIKRLVYLHRVILGLPFETDGRDGDHINRNKADNRRSNLRILPSDNANKQNRSPKPGAASQYRGVSLDKRDHKWMAHIRVNGKSIYLGRFDSEEDAASTAKAARLQMMPFAVD